MNCKIKENLTKSLAKSGNMCYNFPNREIDLVVGRAVCERYDVVTFETAGQRARFSYLGWV